MVAPGGGRWTAPTAPWPDVRRGALGRTMRYADRRPVEIKGQFYRLRRPIRRYKVTFDLARPTSVDRETPAGPHRIGPTVLGGGTAGLVASIVAGVVDEQGDLDAVVEVELGQDARHVRLHGRDAEEEGRADLGVRLALADRDRDLAFPVVSSSRSTALVLRWSLPDAATRVIRRLVTVGEEDGLSGGHPPYRLDDLARWGVLEHEPGRARAEGPSTCSSASNVVRMTTSGAPGRRRTASVAVRPSVPGIRMSMSTTSGESRSINPCTPVPSPASPTTPMSRAPPPASAQPGPRAADRHRRSTPEWSRRPR